MLDSRAVFSMARALIRKDGTPVPVEERDAFSTIERLAVYGDYLYAILWGKALKSDVEQSRMYEVEYIKISSWFPPEDYETEEVLEEVFFGVWSPEDETLETYLYFPDVWDECLVNRAKACGLR